MAHICIFYRWNTLDTALRVRAGLCSVKHTIWLINAEHPVWENSPYQNRAFRTSTVIIILLDTSFLRSRHLQHVVTLARTQKKYVIPVLVEPVPLDVLPSKGHYIDATESVDDTTARLIRVINRIVPGRARPDHNAKKRSVIPAFPVKQQFITPLAVGAVVCALLIGLSFPTLLTTTQSQVPTLAVLPTPPALSVILSIERFPDQTRQVRPPDMSSGETDDAPGRMNNFIAANTEAGLSTVSETESVLATETVSDSDKDIVAANRTPSSIVALLVQSPTSVSVIQPVIIGIPTSTPQPHIDYEVPVAHISASPEQGTAPLTVHFSNDSTGKIVSYAWDFDGNGAFDSHVVKPPPFTYEQPGSYAARLAISLPDGSQLWAVARIEVDPDDGSEKTEKGKPSFSATPERGVAPLAVAFTNLSSGDITSYHWDFNNDGTVDSTEASPTPYTYEKPGIYFASLIVSDTDGDSLPFLSMIIVDEDISPVMVTPITVPATNTLVPTSTPTAPQQITPVPTASTTPKPTATRTATPSPTPTLTPTATSTPTLEQSPEVTLSETLSETVTATDMVSVTLTETDTPTPAESPEITSSETPSATPTTTATTLATLTATNTPTLDQSPSIAPSATPTTTATNTASATATEASTPTLTQSPEISGQ